VNNWKVIFATVVIFGVGVVTGGLLMNYVQHSHPKMIRRPANLGEVRPAATNQLARSADLSKARLPDILNKQFLQRLDEELHLSAEQRAAIQKTIGDNQNQMRKVIQDARLEIRDILMPEQRQQFDQLVKRPVHKQLFNTNSPAILPATNTPAI
jgi:uncharacterized membrane protein